MADCHKCFAAGHTCIAQTADENERPVCAFCADGEACPVMKKLGLAERMTKYNGGTPPEGIDIAPAKPAKPPTTKKEQPIIMNEKCAASDCNKPATRPSGHCSTRCYQRDYYHKTHPGSKHVPNARVVDEHEFKALPPPQIECHSRAEESREGTQVTQVTQVIQVQKRTASGGAIERHRGRCFDQQSAARRLVLSIARREEGRHLPNVA